VTSSIHSEVILVYPPFEQPICKAGRYYTGLPLGIAYLAASLERRGISVSVFDCNVEPYQPEKLASTIVDCGPKVLGITVTSPGLRYARELISQVRSQSVGRGTPSIAVGGRHIGADPGSSRLLGADTLFVGEADVAFAEYCSGGYGRVQSTVSGGVDGYCRLQSTVSSGGSTTISGDGSERPSALSAREPGGPSIVSCGVVEDLNSLPYPSRHLFKEKLYRHTPVAASRGCPYKCIYCAGGGCVYRRRSGGNVGGEVKELVDNHHTKSIDFVDDTFTLERDYAISICDIMREFDIPWACTTRADLIDSELIKRMSDAGCMHISFGVESGSERVRYGLGKRISNNSYVDAFKSCREHDIKTMAYALLGLPGETRGDLQATLDFVTSLEPDAVMYSPVTVYPGSELMDSCVRNNHVSPTAWTDYMLGKSDMPHYVPDGLTLEELYSISFDYSRKFYLTPRHILQRLKSAETVGDVLDCTLAAAYYAWGRF